MDDLPLLVNGKVDRQALMNFYENRTTNNLDEKIFDLSTINSEEEETARVLLKCLLKILGPSAPRKVSLDQSFFHIGGNSLNAILAITSLRDLGYDIGISQFLEAETLKDILPYMNQKTEDPFNEEKMCDKNQSKIHFPYIQQPLENANRNEVISMLSKCFAKKGDLEIMLGIQEPDYERFLHQMWDELINQKLSFAVLREGTEEMIAVSLNTDLYKEPHVEEISPKIAHIFDFLEDMEAPVRDRLPVGVGKVVHSVMMGTKESIDMKENIFLIQFMELENMKVGKGLGYAAMFTTNTSDLTQQVCDDLLSYSVLADNQVNLWRASDGSKPFGDAPDSQRAVVTAKLL